MKRLVVAALVLLCLPALAACGGSIPPDLPVESGGNEANIIFEPSALESVLRQMTLEEKVAKMLMASCHEQGSAQRAAAAGLGGVCLYADAFEGKSIAEVTAFTGSLQSMSGAGLLISVDEEGGSVCRISTNPALRGEPFLSPLQLYEKGGMELIKNDTAEKSALLLALGINVNLAPVCDVPLGTGDYMYSRSFGLDAKATAEYVSLVVGVMKQQGIGCSLKHFPGYGGSADTHKGMAYDSRPYEDFTAGDFLPFEAGILAGADSVLVSHNIVECMDPEQPASLSPEVHRVLRQELGFEGVIISDDMFMDAIVQFTGGSNPAVQAVLAGNDLICCADFESAAAAILAAVEEKIIPSEQIDASVLRILRWKRSLGLDISRE